MAITKGRLQYSIRTLLLITAAISLVLGVLVNRVRTQAEAVAAIQAVNGRVYYDFQVAKSGTADFRQRSSVPAWLLKIFGLNTFHRVVAVDLNGPEVTDSTLIQFRNLPAVRRVFIMDATISNEGLQSLQVLTNCQRLHLINCSGIDDDSLTILADFHELLELDIQNVHVTDRGIDCLKQHHGLRRLVLDRTDVTEDGVCELQRAIPNCKVEY